MEERLIFELEPEEKTEWKNIIKTTRESIVKKPIKYVEKATSELGISKENILASASECIQQIREKSWSFYIEDEAFFHKDVLSHLVKNETIPNEILQYTIGLNFDPGDALLHDDEKFIDSIANIVGDYSGRIMPYIYELSLSTTNSRRSRSGTTFEEIIYYIMTLLDYPFVNQSHLGNAFFDANNLGKKVDMIIPTPEAYAQNRSKCHIVTMKTSLRERWQEVVEEINRTNIPHIYLLTLDPSITDNTMQILQNHNITIVSYQTIKDRLTDYDNIMSFEHYFNREIPHVMAYWE